jgi:carbonic anhydrase
MGIVGATSLEDAIVRNVRAVKDGIRRDSTLLREAEQTGDFTIVGAFYDIKTATVRFL